MSIGQLNIYGKDKVEVAIERFQNFEPHDGYYLAFSGGKDSSVIKALADMAGVKYDAHYNITSVDPPELVQFIKREHPDVIMERRYSQDGKPVTMWNLIPKKKMPPTRMVRYCCQELKESGGEDRFVVTGVRHSESIRRRNRGGLEVSNSKRGLRDWMDPDNPDQGLIHLCQMKKRRILNPIIDWTEDEVWEFIHKYNVPYCKLYDEGFKRLGCIGCPMAGKNRLKEFKRYPKIEQAYIRAFERMLKARQEAGLPCEEWKTGEDVMRWYLEK